jgi:type II restriction enzyme
MKPIQARIDSWVQKSGNPQSGWGKVLDCLHDILQISKDDINKILDIRLVSGEISHKKQAVRSISSNLLINTIIYIFIQNKLVGNISERVFINKKLIIPDLKKYPP